MIRWYALTKVQRRISPCRFLLCGRHLTDFAFLSLLSGGVLLYGDGVVRQTLFVVEGFPSLLAILTPLAYVELLVSVLVQCIGLLGQLLGEHLIDVEAGDVADFASLRNEGKFGNVLGLLSDERVAGLRAVILKIRVNALCRVE